MTDRRYDAESPQPFYDDRAPPSPPRPRANLRSRGTCPDCEVEDGEIHAVDCPPLPRGGYVG